MWLVLLTETYDCMGVRRWGPACVGWLLRWEDKVWL